MAPEGEVAYSEREIASIDFLDVNAETLYSVRFDGHDVELFGSTGDSLAFTGLTKSEAALLISFLGRHYGIDDG